MDGSLGSFYSIGMELEENCSRKGNMEGTCHRFLNAGDIRMACRRSRLGPGLCTCCKDSTSNLVEQICFLSDLQKPPHCSTLLLINQYTVT